MPARDDKRAARVTPSLLLQLAQSSTLQRGPRGIYFSPAAGV
jgi:hypothetical protein